MFGARQSKLQVIAPQVTTTARRHLQSLLKKKSPTILGKKHSCAQSVSQTFLVNGKKKGTQSENDENRLTAQP